MVHVVDCPQCSRSIRLPDDSQGKRIRCGDCQTIHRIVDGDDGALALEAQVGAGPTPEPAEDAAPDSAVETPAAVSLPCEGCGEPVTAADKFCTHCGAPVSEEFVQRIGQAAARRGNRARRRSHADRKAVNKAARWILALAVMFVIAGFVEGRQASRQADTAHRVLAEYADDEELELEDGTVSTAADLRSQIDAEVVLVYVIDFGLALIMAGISFWARVSAFPAIVTALCIYLVLIVLNAIVDPTTIVKGVLWKVLILGALIGGLQSALGQRAAAARAARGGQAAARRRPRVAAQPR